MINILETSSQLLSDRNDSKSNLDEKKKIFKKQKQIKKRVKYVLYSKGKIISKGKSKKRIEIYLQTSLNTSLLISMVNKIFHNFLINLREKE